MPERRGGSYVADPRTGEERLVEGTVQEDAHPVEPAPEPAADTIEAPAPPAPEAPPPAPEPASQDEAAGDRRGAPGKKE